MPGAAPAFQASRWDPGTALKSDSPWSGAGRLLGRRILVSAQILLALLLVIAAGLFTRTMSRMRAIDLGFDQENVVSFRVNPQHRGYPGPEQALVYFREVLRRLREVPGVRSVSASTIGVLSGNGWASGIKVEGYTPREGEHAPLRNTVASGYFTTLGIPLIVGRDFTPADTTGAPQVAVVNEAFARFYYGGGESHRPAYLAGRDTVHDRRRGERRPLRPPARGDAPVLVRALRAVLAPVGAGHGLRTFGP